MSENHNKTVALTPDIINKVGDINKLKQICNHLFVQCEKLLNNKSQLKDTIRIKDEKISEIELRSQCNQIKIESCEQIIRGLIAEKEEMEIEIQKRDETINSLKIDKCGITKAGKNSDLEFSILDYQFFELMKNETFSIVTNPSFSCIYENQQCNSPDISTKMQKSIIKTHCNHQLNISKGDSFILPSTQISSKVKENLQSKIQDLELLLSKHELKLNEMSIENNRLNDANKGLLKYKVACDNLENRVSQLQQETEEKQIIIHNFQELDKNNSRKITQLSASISELEKEKAEILSRLTVFEKDNVLMKSIQKEITILQKENQDLSESIRIQKESSIEVTKQEIANVSIEKDEVISKLKTLVQRFVKSDQRKQQQIDDLQAELSSLTSKPKESMPHSSADLMIKITQLEGSVNELTERLSRSQASIELEEKNQKMAKMLDKSNRLYIQLLEQNQILKDELKAINHKHDLIISDILPHISISNTESQIEPVLSQNVAEDIEKLKIMQSYLKRVLLQFFLQDDSKRSALVSLILELVGCSDSQIIAAQKKWDKENQFLQKSTGFFGF